MQRSFNAADTAEKKKLSQAVAGLEHQPTFTAAPHEPTTGA